MQTEKRVNGTLTIGTRGSELALAQANQVRDLILKANGLEPDAVSIKIIKTSGDIILDRPLSEVGGKGLFTKEIEVALADGEIDLGVHSSKDMATVMPDGLEMEVFLPREDVRDAFICGSAATLDDLPQGAVVGSSSLRRQAQLKRHRPDLEVVMFRGNVQTRLKKLEDGVAEATLLASAGINRLGLTDVVASYLDTKKFLPACAQGAIGLQTRTGDEQTRAMIEPLNHQETKQAAVLERAFLEVLDGSCRTPIGGLALVEGDKISFKGEVLRPDGSESHQIEIEGAVDDACELGKEAGLKLKAQLPDDFFADLDVR